MTTLTSRNGEASTRLGRGSSNEPERGAGEVAAAPVLAGAVRDEFRSAVEDVAAQEHEHLQWATTMKERLVMREARSSSAANRTEKGDELLVRVANWFDS